jgi:hypothetical protein
MKQPGGGGPPPGSPPRRSSHASPHGVGAGHARPEALSDKSSREVPGARGSRDRIEIDGSRFMAGLSNPRLCAWLVIPVTVFIAGIRPH